MAILRNYIEGNLTQLNKLKYGDSATIGNEPIVQKIIPTDIRQEGPSSNQVSKRIDDLKRIGTILTQKPGLKYLANETALNAAKVTPKSDPNKTVAGNILSGIGANLFNSVKIIGSTLLQVPLNGTGTHFVKGFAGKGKGTYMSGLDTAPHTLARQSGIVFNNIPIDAVSTGEETAGGKSIEGGLLGNIETETQRRFNKQRNESTYLTNLEVAPSTLSTAGKPVFSDTPVNAAPSTDETTGGLLAEAGKLKYKESPTQKLTTDSNTLYSSSLDTVRKVKKENRILLGDPSAIKHKISDSYSGTNNKDTQDKINLISPYKGTRKSTSETNDLIKFRFNVITPEDNTYLHFRAYLDSFSDNYTGNWNTFNYVGRGENFHTYQGFNRQISLGFKIAAQSRWEMRPLYQKIVHLASTTAPTYSGAGYMRGTFVKLTVGDYVRELPGFISSVNYNWQQDYQWEIALNNQGAGDNTGQDNDQQELPMVLDCQLNFTPIHTFTPETGLRHYITADNTVKPESKFFENGVAIPQPKL